MHKVCVVGVNTRVFVVLVFSAVTSVVLIKHIMVINEGISSARGMYTTNKRVIERNNAGSGCRKALNVWVETTSSPIKPTENGTI